MTHTGTITLAGVVLEPTGIGVVVHGVTIGEFADGLICSLRPYWDEVTVLEQLGTVDRFP